MARLTAQTREGEEFALRPKRITMERLWTFSGGPFAQEGWPRKNLHTHQETALAQGLPKLATSGTQYQGYVLQLLLELFGDDWFYHGTMTAKFVAMVDAGETLTAKAAVRSREAIDNCVKFTLDVWCENQQGEKALVGSATGMVPALSGAGVPQRA